VTTRVVDWSDGADAWLEPAIKLVVRRAEPVRRPTIRAHAAPAALGKKIPPRERLIFRSTSTRASR
jgi:hypothetical protein